MPILKGNGCTDRSRRDLNLSTRGRHACQLPSGREGLNDGVHPWGCNVLQHGIPAGIGHHRQARITIEGEQEGRNGGDGIARRGEGLLMNLDAPGNEGDERNAGGGAGGGRTR